MEEFPTQGRYIIVPVCGGTSTLSREATLAARWLHGPSQFPIGRWGWGFYAVQGGIDVGGHYFRPRVVGVVDLQKDFRHGGGILLSPSAVGPRRCPEGQLSARADSLSPTANQQSANGGWC